MIIEERVSEGYGYGGKEGVEMDAWSHEDGQNKE